MPKMNEYVQTFIVKEEIRAKSNKLTSFRIYDEKRFEKYKVIWTKIEY